MKSLSKSVIGKQASEIRHYLCTGTVSIVNGFIVEYASRLLLAWLLIGNLLWYWPGLAAQQDLNAKRKVAEQTATEARQAIVSANEADRRAAIGKLESAISIWQETNDTDEVIAALNDIGKIRVSIKEYEQALSVHRRALELAQSLKDVVAEADSHLLIGQAYDAMGGKDRKQAITAYLQALEKWAKVTGARGFSGKAKTLKFLGSAYSTTGDKRKALECYEQTMPLWVALKNREETVNALYSIGTIQDALGESLLAVEKLSEALKLAREPVTDARPFNRTAAETGILNNLGVVYSTLGEPEKALDRLNESLKLSESLSDGKQKAKQQATTLTSIGFIYSSLGDKEEALRYMEKALPLRQMAGDKSGEAYTLNNIGAIQSAMGDDKDAALNPLKAARQIASNDDKGKDKDAALDSFKAARQIWKDIGDKVGESLALNNMGVAESELGNRARALDYLKQALEIRKKNNARREQANTMLNTGLVRLASGETESALTIFEETLPTLRKTGDRNGQAVTLQAMARVEAKLGQWGESRKHIEEAIALIESLRNKLESKELRASYLASVQDYHEFYVDLLMQQVKGQSDKARMSEAFQAHEHGRARVLLEMLNESRADLRGDADTNFLAQERRLQLRLNATLGRQLLALEREQDELAETLTQELNDLLVQHQRLQTEIRKTSPRYASLTQPQALPLREIQRQTLDQDTLLLEYALGEERSYLWAITSDEITSYVLPPRAEIEAAANKFYKSLTWRNDPERVLGQAKAVSTGEVNCSSPVSDNGRVLGQAKNSATTAVSDKQKNEWKEVGPGLSKMLLAPVAAKLLNKRLLIVPDGALHYVPFAALPELENSKAGIQKGQPLIVAHEIVTLPSISTLAIVRKDFADRKPAPRNLAIIADPVFDLDDDRNKNQQKTTLKKSDSDDKARVLGQASKIAGAPSMSRLKCTRQEAERILSMSPASSRIWLDFNANRETATGSELSQYRILHFATHGFLNPLRPELSGIVLSLVNEGGGYQDGFLLTPEIFSLKFPSELVVLSACQTALGKDIKGEGVVGLTRGLMYAGSKRVVVSLWSVGDRATAELMERFYDQMLRKNLRPAAALRAAQIAMWQQSPQREDPYYWAAFILQGEW